MGRASLTQEPFSVTRVLAVYATDYGSTQQMAEAIATGARSTPHAEVEVTFER